MEALNETVDIEWSYSPVHSNNTVVLLSADKHQSGSVISTTDKIKYFRTVRNEFTITDVAASDAGTYMCRLLQHNVKVNAELYVIGKLFGDVFENYFRKHV